eukprot:7390784-Prymnesium_polylepis.1
MGSPLAPWGRSVPGLLRCEVLHDLRRAAANLHLLGLAEDALQRGGRRNHAGRSMAAAVVAVAAAAVLCQRRWCRGSGEARAVQQ